MSSSISNGRKRNVHCGIQSLALDHVGPAVPAAADPRTMASQCAKLALLVIVMLLRHQRSSDLCKVTATPWVAAGGAGPRLILRDSGSRG
jgi:hypothetical protein